MISISYTGQDIGVYRFIEPFTQDLKELKKSLDPVGHQRSQKDTHK